jgi:hypothetical protein
MIAITEKAAGDSNADREKKTRLNAWPVRGSRDNLMTPVSLVMAQTIHGSISRARKPQLRVGDTYKRPRILTTTLTNSLTTRYSFCALK